MQGGNTLEPNILKKIISYQTILFKVTERRDMRENESNTMATLITFHYFWAHMIKVFHFLLTILLAHKEQIETQSIRSNYSHKDIPCAAIVIEVPHEKKGSSMNF